MADPFLTERFELAEQAILRDRAALAGGILDVLNRGMLIGDAIGSVSALSSDQNAMLRELRRQLAERDLYEFLYGSLPADAVDPTVNLDPWRVRQSPEAQREYWGNV